MCSCVQEFLMHALFVGTVRYSDTLACFGSNYGPYITKIMTTRFKVRSCVCLRCVWDGLVLACHVVFSRAHSWTGIDGLCWIWSCLVRLLLCWLLLRCVCVQSTNEESHYVYSCIAILLCFHASQVSHDPNWTNNWLKTICGRSRILIYRDIQRTTI